MREDYRNKAENSFQNFINGLGYQTTKRGWPDFLCFKDGSFICVEVKRHPTHRLKHSQHRAMELLSSKGVECFVWDPITGSLRPWSEVEAAPERKMSRRRPKS